MPGFRGGHSLRQIEQLAQSRDVAAIEQLAPGLLEPAQGASGRLTLDLGAHRSENLLSLSAGEGDIERGRGRRSTRRRGGGSSARRDRCDVPRDGREQALARAGVNRSKRGNLERQLERLAQARYIAGRQQLGARRFQLFQRDARSPTSELGAGESENLYGRSSHGQRSFSRSSRSCSPIRTKELARATHARYRPRREERPRRAVVRDAAPA